MPSEAEHPDGHRVLAADDGRVEAGVGGAELEAAADERLLLVGIERVWQVDGAGAIAAVAGSGAAAMGLRYAACG